MSAVDRGLGLGEQVHQQRAETGPVECVGDLPVPRADLLLPLPWANRTTPRAATGSTRTPGNSASPTATVTSRLVDTLILARAGSRPASVRAGDPHIDPRREDRAEASPEPCRGCGPSTDSDVTAAVRREGTEPPVSEELAYATATDLAARIRRRELSPVELIDAVIARIEARNPSVNAFVFTGFDDARSGAKAGGARGHARADARPAARRARPP